VGWDLRSLKKAFEVPHPHAPNDVTCVAAHPSRAAAVVGYGNGDVALFDIRGQGSLLHVMPLHTDQCRSVEFSPNGAYVATAAFDCNVVIAEASTLEPTKVATTHCTAMLFIPALLADPASAATARSQGQGCAGALASHSPVAANVQRR
jgi:WD40 repeat protein